MNEEKGPGRILFEVQGEVLKKGFKQEGDGREGGNKNPV